MWERKPETVSCPLLFDTPALLDPSMAAHRRGRLSPTLTGPPCSTPCQMGGLLSQDKAGLAVRWLVPSSPLQEEKVWDAGTPFNLLAPHKAHTSFTLSISLRLLGAKATWGALPNPTKGAVLRGLSEMMPGTHAGLGSRGV